MSTALLQWSVLAISLASSVHTSPLSTSHSVPASPSYRSPLTLAPFHVSEHPHGTLNNSYIVVLRNDLPASLKDNHFNFLQSAHNSDPLDADGSGIQQIYDGHITGYAGRFTEQTIQQVRAMPEVEYVEQDQIVHTMELTTQKAAPWVSHIRRVIRPWLTRSNQLGTGAY